MIGLIIAAALIQAGDPCHAVPQGMTDRRCPPWRSLDRTARFEIFENPASLTRGAGMFEISLRFVYPTDQPLGVRSLILRERFDCANRTWVLRHINAFDAAGVMQEDQDNQGGPAVPVSGGPGAPEPTLLAEYCPH